MVDEAQKVKRLSENALQNCYDLSAIIARTYTAKDDLLPSLSYVVNVSAVQWGYFS